MKVAAKYLDNSAKNPSGAFGKVTTKNFRGQTPTRVFGAKAKWERTHPWMSPISFEEVADY